MIGIATIWLLRNLCYDAKKPTHETLANTLRANVIVKKTMFRVFRSLFAFLKTTSTRYVTESNVRYVSHVSQNIVCEQNFEEEDVNSQLNISIFGCGFDCLDVT